MIVGVPSLGVGPLAAQTPRASEIDAIFAEYDMPGSVGCASGEVADLFLADQMER